MKKQKGNIPVLLVFIAIILSGTVYLFLNNGAKTPVRNSLPSSSPKSDDESTKIFKSETMKFSIEILNSLSVKEESSRTTVNSVDGQIYIGRNGTQFDSLDDYLNNFDQNTDFALKSDEKNNINNYEARKRLFEKTDVSEKGEKIYFIYVDSFVYKISTSSLLLYDDLDQIAQSFRYIP